MNEFALIEKYFAPLAATEGRGLKDDAAFLNPPAGETLVVTQDAIIEGVHYIGDEPPSLIARKLLRCSLSDLAAKGAKPWGCLISLVLPPDADEPWIADFARGLKEDFSVYGLALFGGDTTKGKGPASFSMTAVGRTPDGMQLQRSGACAGDLICVTGTLGDAGFGLLAAQGKLQGLSVSEKDFLMNRYRLPEPRLGWGIALRSTASSGMDVSDGLMQDLSHLAHASRLGAEIMLERLPFSPAVRGIIRREPSFALHPATAGDDYELLFTVSESALPRLPSERDGAGFTVIGRMTEGTNVRLLDGNQQPAEIAKAGWQHL